MANVQLQSFLVNSNESGIEWCFLGSTKQYSSDTTTAGIPYLDYKCRKIVQGNNSISFSIEGFRHLKKLCK
jgi:hypothetical protein